MDEIKVIHGKWLDHGYEPKVLFHDKDENYTMIWGKYEGEFALGVRWHSGGLQGKGFPSQGSVPTWYVEPDFLIIPILKEILAKSIVQDNKTYIDNIREALKIMEELKS